MMIVVLLSSLIACGGEPAAEVAETEAPTEEAVPATEAPTATPEPTDTPEPEPTDTPEPTPTEEPTVEATVAAEFELEPLEHPSGAFSSLMPVDASFSDVDADASEFPSVRAVYMDQQTELIFGVMASVQPKADDVTLADMPEDVISSLFWSMSPEDIESIEILNQEQLDEDRLLLDLKGFDETLSESKLLLVDGGSSAFVLLFFTSDAEATEAAWMEIREGYTYDPALTADLLAEITDAAAAEVAAIASIELERMEHPSGAFSILIPVDSWSTGVDSAAESKYPNLYSSYVEDDIGFGLEAAVFPKPEDAALEDMFDVFLNDVILQGKIDVEVVSQEQERLDDDRLLADVALLSPSMAGQPLHQKVLLVDGGTSVFGLLVEDQDLEATEPVWTEIFNSYTYDPELTADLLAEY
jgi:hypothetical protein